jgi:hypothetical protein
MTGGAIWNVMMVSPVFRRIFRVIASSCEAIQGRKQRLDRFVARAPHLPMRRAPARRPLQRKTPPRISAGGFQVKQFTLTKAHHETGPVKR